MNNKILDKIRDVWGEFEDFDSLDYIGFVVQQEALEIRKSNYEEAEKEFVDIIICCIRAIDENSDNDIEKLILNRLEKRMDGKQEQIVERYKSKYNN